MGPNLLGGKLLLRGKITLVGAFLPILVLVKDIPLRVVRRTPGTSQTHPLNDMPRERRNKVKDNKDNENSYKIPKTRGRHG